MQTNQVEEERVFTPFEVIQGGLATDGYDPNWLAKLERGQWFISKPIGDGQPQLWFLKFKFKTVYMLYTNLNVEFRTLVVPHIFSKENTLIELLDLENG